MTGIPGEGWKTPKCFRYNLLVSVDANDQNSPAFLFGSKFCLHHITRKRLPNHEVTSER